MSDFYPAVGPRAQFRRYLRFNLICDVRINWNGKAKSAAFALCFYPYGTTMRSYYRPALRIGQGQYRRRCFLLWWAR